jgi:hypothetical protein
MIDPFGNEENEENEGDDGVCTIRVQVTILEPNSYK